MNNKNMLIIVAVVIVVVLLGYFLFFRGSNSGNNSNYYPTPTSQQASPSASQPTPSSTLQPNQPGNLQDQGAAAPTPGGQIQLNANDNGSPSTAAPSKVTDVTIKSMAFSPAQITVAAGSTVRWTNQDSVAHTVTSDNGKFGSGNLSTGDTFQFTFTTPGTYTYHCSIHPNMKATVVVQ